MISVIVPTVDGRTESRKRCLRAYRRHGGDLQIIVIHGRPTCGEAWQEGAEQAKGDYIHFTADDLEPHPNWWQVAKETVDEGYLPCPWVFNPNGSVQSAGGQMSADDNLLKHSGDRQVVQFTTVPFMSRAQWEQIGPMFPGHYMTDVYVSEMGRRAGIETIARTGYCFTHYNEKAGRGAGMSQNDRVRLDRELYTQALTEGVK